MIGKGYGKCKINILITQLIKSTYNKYFNLIKWHEFEFFVYEWYYISTYFINVKKKTKKLQKSVVTTHFICNIIQYFNFDSIYKNPNWKKKLKLTETKNVRRPMCYFWIQGVEDFE